MEASALDRPGISYPAELVIGIVLLYQGDSTAKAIWADVVGHCRTMVDETPDYYFVHYALATALAGQAVCNPFLIEESKRLDLLTPALTEYQRALDVCAAPGVVQDAIRDLELIQATGIEGLESVFELLTSALEQQTSGIRNEVSKKSDE
jgi:hypothetical protein